MDPKFKAFETQYTKNTKYATPKHKNYTNYVILMILLQTTILRENTPFSQCGFTDFHHTNNLLNCAAELVHTGSNQERYREHKYTNCRYNVHTFSQWQEKKTGWERRNGEWRIVKYETFIGLQKSASAVPAPLLTHLRQNKQTLNAPAIPQNPWCLFHSDSLKKHEEPDALLNYLTNWRMSNTTKHASM